MMKKRGELTEIQLNPPKTKKCEISSERGHAHLSSTRALHMTLY